MTAKEFLEQLVIAKKQIDYYHSKIDELHAMSKRISGCDFEEKNQATPSTDPRFVYCLDEISELEHILSEKIAECVILEVNIIKVIQNLKDIDTQLVLEHCFLEGKTTKQTAKEMGYSTSWVSGKKRQGLEMLDKILATSDVQ